MSELIKNFELCKGDVAVVTGDFNRYIFQSRKKCKSIQNLLNDLIDEMIDALTPEGTLMFHTFTWDFCHGINYDIKHTKSKTGALGSVALMRDDFVRTRHPIYSFAVYGKYKDELLRLDNTSSFGDDSPFAFIHKMNAKMVIVNLSFDHSFTFVHYVEQQNLVDYRFEKTFIGGYIDELGEFSKREYSMFVRRDNVFTNLTPLEDIFLKQKIMKINIVNNNEIKIFKAKSAYEIIKKDIKENRARNLYTIKL
ncbi:AAC(3) family N-acetyltransferase [Campylobacter sp. faydin G-24]|uniref:Aminoglycoside N(3)-acetyltransferase n=1 Tax=Campylobacter anatolicus TaxID=2829105 RepID=A0ABS5HJ88_9BACT|nr:AAC(3) family N-acetyltransferase [Campylobacter anatolicus]MBR8464335.1 AAC(3) family N-acetyltransferase [Campylobacter anatolicus]